MNNFYATRLGFIFSQTGYNGIFIDDNGFTSCILHHIDSSDHFIFLHSEGLDLIISYIGVAVFVALTAYDTQKIKKAVAYATPDMMATIALSGAFELYLDFINIFLRLLRIMGRRK